MLLSDRVAVVTGAGSGIGREIAVAFAAEGARVAVVDRRPRQAERCRGRRRRAGSEGAALLRHGRARRGRGRATSCGDVASETGRIDVLVNSAGVREIGDVYTLSAEEWENVIAINLSGTFYCCQAAARMMRETGGGSIVNISSVGGLIGPLAPTRLHRPRSTASSA